MTRIAAALPVFATVVMVSAFAPTRAAGPETFGAAPSLAALTAITDVAARPAAFEGKTVRVEGVVTAVCTVAGCWMALAPADDPMGPTIRFKVDDGVIVFPLSARGRRATAQGAVERIQMSDAHGREAAAEHAHADHAPAGRISDQWHVRATGAIVY